jgi:hypothetical protein
MKVILACLVVVATSGPAVAADPVLWPCQPGGFGYEPGIERTIRAALSTEPEISAIIYPSFAPEWGVALVNDAQGPVVVLSQFANSYWASGWARIDEDETASTVHPKGPVVTKWSYEKDSPPERWTWDGDAAHSALSVTKTPVSTNLAARLREVWSAAMAGIGPRDPNMLGLDGVTYQFQVGRQSCGSTWSPSSETIPGKLVSLVEQLKMLDRSRVEPEGSLREKEILATAAEILGEFGRRSQAP